MNQQQGQSHQDTRADSLHTARRASIAAAIWIVATLVVNGVSGCWQSSTHEGPDSIVYEGMMESAS